jgi:multidrug efflux pump
MAAKHPVLAQVRVNGLEDNSRFQVKIDRAKASSLGLALPEIDQIFSLVWSPSYVNNFLDRDGRVKKVLLQGDAPYRMNPEDISYWYARNAKGKMVPFSAFVTTSWAQGSPSLERYNGMSSIEIQGNAAPGRSTGDAMKVIERLAEKLPPGIGYEWTGMSFQERLSGSQASILYAISVLVVFLSLAALYESWSIPLSVILVVPLGVMGALLAATLRGLSNDVYFQVGLLTTVGLSAKNAILIVEFANHLYAQGKTATEAALEAARLRLRPILMTSLAFILGVLPLAISHGAGAASQHAIGTGVIGGMLTATFLAIFIIPLSFVLVCGKFRPAHSSVADISTTKL